MSSITGGVPEIERARKGVAVWMNDDWSNAVIDSGCVSSETLWVNFTEGDVAETEGLWNGLDRVVDRVSSGYKLCVLGDLKR